MHEHTTATSFFVGKAMSQTTGTAAERAEEAKAKGNAAFKAKDYDEAVRARHAPLNRARARRGSQRQNMHAFSPRKSQKKICSLPCVRRVQIAQFTAAIEADPTNHVLYSNRSGAHAAKASFTPALLDANKCIELKSDWAKGYSRRGAAYFGLKNWIQAQASYEKGLELDPASAVMKSELEQVKLHRNPAARAAAQAAGTFPGGVPASPPPSTGRLARFVSLGALICGLFYAVPILGPRRAFQCYSFSVIQVNTPRSAALFSLSL